MKTDVPAEHLGAETARMIAALESGSFAPAFKDCLEIAHKSIGVNFAATAAPHGGEWPPRKKVGDGHPLLIESGRLFQSATSDVGEGHVGEIGDREASTGVDPNAVPYAATQNFGNPNRNIPAREFEDVDDATLDAMLERVADRGIELLL
ncbi:MAG TPA: hypothetical protein VG125_21720 [Pirellulales bacterium]|jgi:phage gpG-like protein|nr:hypothetical protein [Pirellulales bacterium]